MKTSFVKFNRKTARQIIEHAIEGCELNLGMNIGGEREFYWRNELHLMNIIKSALDNTRTKSIEKIKAKE